MKLRAYAKINIGLRILGKRPDDYHNLETVFHEIDLFDEIELEPHNQLEITADSILVPIDESNLCLRAAQLLQTDQHVQQGVMIHLIKNIPVGAGLGGGSSDAATVLVGLNQFWNLNLTNDQLQQLAGKIGSDVPFFIEGGSAYATGRGEVLKHYRLDIPYWIVLVAPPLHVSTAWAYEHIKLYHIGKTKKLKDALTKQVKNPQELTTIVQNDFETSVFETYPEIASIKKKLLNIGAVFALMSGSGSSVFGFFDKVERAKKASSEFPKNYTISITEPNFSSR